MSREGGKQRCFEKAGTCKGSGGWHTDATPRWLPPLPAARCRVVFAQYGGIALMLMALVCMLSPRVDHPGARAPTAATNDGDGDGDGDDAPLLPIHLSAPSASVSEQRVDSISSAGGRKPLLWSEELDSVPSGSLIGTSVVPDSPQDPQRGGGQGSYQDRQQYSDQQAGGWQGSGQQGSGQQDVLTAPAGSLPQATLRNELPSESLWKEAMAPGGTGRGHMRRVSDVELTETCLEPSGFKEPGFRAPESEVSCGSPVARFSQTGSPAATVVLGSGGGKSCRSSACAGHADSLADEAWGEEACGHQGCGCEEEEGEEDDASLQGSPMRRVACEDRESEVVIVYVPATGADALPAGVKSPLFSLQQHLHQPQSGHDHCVQFSGGSLRSSDPGSDASTAAAPARAPSRGPKGMLGLSPESRNRVMRLCALFVVDSFGSGMVTGSLLAYYFQVRALRCLGNVPCSA